MHSGVVVDEAVHVVCCKDAGLDEAQERVELLQAVLDGSPSQQDPKIHRELCEKHTNRRSGQSDRNKKTQEEQKERQLPTSDRVWCNREFGFFSL